MREYPDRQFVYLMFREDGAWKVGYSNCPSRRLEELEKLMRMKLKLVRTWELPNAYYVEQRAHLLLAGCRIKDDPWASREMFRGTERFIARAIGKAIYDLNEPIRRLPWDKRPEMLAMVERFNEVAPRDWDDPDKPRRIGFIKGVPQGSADQQREWMYSMGVHPCEHFLDNQVHKGMDGLDDALSELSQDCEFYLWSPEVLRAPRSMDAVVARVNEAGAALIVKER